MPFRKPSQPYSFPELNLFPQRTKTQLRKRFRHKSDSEIPKSTWFADLAAPPLLVTFDAFDTLYTPAKPIPEQYAEVAHAYGYNNEDMTAENIARTFREAYKAVSAELPNQGKDKGLSPFAWWKVVMDRTFRPLLPNGHQWIKREMKNELYWRFASRAGYTLFPDVQNFLQLVGTAYQARNWPPRRTMLGIISNSDPRVRSILESFKIPITPALFPPRFTPLHRGHRQDFGPAHFAFATLSYECGVEKPDQEIYRAALRDAQRTVDRMDPVARLTRSGKDLLDNVNAEFHLMHVGDDLEKDVIPAMRAGWDAILLDRSAGEAVSVRPVTQHEGVQEVTVVNGLDKLPQLVSRERLEAKLRTRLRGGEENRERVIKRVLTDPRKLKGRTIVPHPVRDEAEIAKSWKLLM